MGRASVVEHAALWKSSTSLNLGVVKSTWSKITLSRKKRWVLKLNSKAQQIWEKKHNPTGCWHRSPLISFNRSRTTITRSFARAKGPFFPAELQDSIVPIDPRGRCPHYSALHIFHYLVSGCCHCRQKWQCRCSHLDMTLATQKTMEGRGNGKRPRPVCGLSA